MGYYIFSYGIKTVEITKVFGSKDQMMWDKITNTEKFKHYQSFFLEGYQTTPEKALKDIIFGEKYDYTAYFAYGYALICICDTLGYKLPYQREIKSMYETEMMSKYLLYDFGVDIFWEDYLLQSYNLPFNIPPINDFPSIGLMSIENQKELLQQLTIVQTKNLDMLKEDQDEKDVYENILGIMHNLSYCIQNNLELISFCH
ncbi:hypothetical protein AD998_17935 [bacterium 336/3]|nr:hypothetical protein AD998_17935 [bacterium 336/3]